MGPGFGFIVSGFFDPRGSGLYRVLSAMVHKHQWLQAATTTAR